MNILVAVPEFRQPPGSGGPANPGWYRDPWGRSAWRWWDGWQWTGWISPPENVSPAIVRQLVESPRPLTQADPEAPARERVPGGAPAGIGPPPPGLGIGPEPAPPAAGREPQGDPGGQLGARVGGPPAMVGDGSEAADAEPFVAGPARPVERSKRRRLLVELVIVLAIFPGPAALAAWVALANSIVGNGPGQRLPTLIKGWPALSFPFLVFDLVLQLAAAALVLYLLSLPGADGGPSAIGLDRRNPRGDAALVLPVFVICYVLAQVLVGQVVAAAHLHGVSPSLGHFPPYYEAVYVLSSLWAGVIEEIVVLGYLVRRLEQLGARPALVVLIAVAVRGSYHLYYGWGVIAILAWALASVLVYRRWRRLAPMIFVHACWDTGLFLAAFHGPTVLVAEAVVLLPTSAAALVAWHRYIPRRRLPTAP